MQTTDGKLMHKDKSFYHKLHGPQRKRAVYRKEDFTDYVLMILITALALAFFYGPSNPMAVIGFVLCGFMIIAFVIRHGVSAGVPLILTRPLQVAYLFYEKITNLRTPYFVAIGLLLIENALIMLTPDAPHNTELMRDIGFGLFYLHIIGLSIYRTAILVDHLRKRELVREILLQTAWKKTLSKQPSITFEIFHAYFTGLLTHIVLVAPWYFIIAHFNFSVILAPVVIVIAVINQTRFLKVINSWFYREHWLGHNSELQFLYLHGTHHDAIPSGLIGVAGNGLLEGVLRNTVAMPHPFYNPIAAALFYTMEVKNDVDLHQYIPGVFPRISKEFIRVAQHSSHHYGRVEPYGFGLKSNLPEINENVRAALLKFPEELHNSIKLDEELTDFEWDNNTHRKIIELYDKYQN